MNNRMKIALMIFVSLAFGTWEFLIVPACQKNQEYSGVIIHSSKSRKWFRGRRSVLERQYKKYNYYWKIRCDDGDSIKVRVPFHQWRHGQEGMPVKKEKGIRWPVVNNREGLALDAESLKNFLHLEK